MPLKTVVCYVSGWRSRRRENYDFGIQNILLLNFFHFLIKEEADLLGLSENTVAKYRSNLGKTLGKDPISDLIE